LATAALELCAERGVQATRVADVAERAGVTVGTVYRYFRDKDDLISAAMKRAEHPLRRAPLPDRPGASLPALAEALRRWGAFFHETGLRGVRLALSDPRRDAASAEGALRDAVEELAAIIVAGMERRDIRGDLDASAVAHSLVGALLLAPMFGRESTGERHLEAISALAVRGLRPDGPSWRP
jgi:AcrR family transcriptional regulator